jgi:hypothetical protein
VSTRTYSQGVARLYFNGGPSVTFRLNPEEVHWNFEVHTSVTETVGGRVVQVTGATLSDMTIRGSFGQKRGSGPKTSSKMAEDFLAAMKKMAAFQSTDSTKQGASLPAAIFSFPPKGWLFSVYIKDLSDPDGGSVTHKPGKYSHAYLLTLMINQDLVVGGKNNTLAVVKDKAIQAYMDRIYNGIGWHQSQYNGGLFDGSTGVTTDVNGKNSQGRRSGGAIN